MNDSHRLMDAATLRLAAARIAHEIAETIAPKDEMMVLGIQRGGVGLARMLATELGRLWQKEVPSGTIDCGMYRDDVHERASPDLYPTHIPGDVTGRIVVLADDVIASGRSVRAAMDALNALGRPKIVRLAVLIDRGRREVPVQPDFRGRTVKTGPTDRVVVKWLAEDGEDAVYVVPA
ncbi:MAG: bifunctional pyr operon transcriptional regulator/uracil phosphoribosyltransferase PyrR [Verrucomicrobiae bacterium]|jgi:pyrimidine operon attenuation protein/uracil phosphoribosyltransferase|nr:bifunctional pyr operon transcriptional regulator/uracil phosphoribosyltransferase PyrR [Verrucomicrobiae bacterium]